MCQCGPVEQLVRRVSPPLWQPHPTPTTSHLRLLRRRPLYDAALVHFIKLFELWYKSSRDFFCRDWMFTD